jgi:cobalt-zinc-cadmium efflux system protein
LHDFGDSIALLVSWLFERGAKKSPNARYTFGYQRLSLFSAFFSASILIGGSIVSARATDTTVKRHEPSETSMCVRNPAGLCVNSRSMPTMAPNATAKSKLRNVSRVNAVCITKNYA